MAHTTAFWPAVQTANGSTDLAALDQSVSPTNKGTYAPTVHTTFSQALGNSFLPANVYSNPPTKPYPDKTALGTANDGSV